MNAGTMSTGTTSPTVIGDASPFTNIATVASLRGRYALSDASPSVNAVDTSFVQFGDAKRRELWHLGRALIKETVAQRFRSQSPSETEVDDDLRDHDLLVVTRTGLGRGLRPVVFRDGHALPWKLSLAHSDDVIAVAVSPSSEIAVGIDVTDTTAESAASLRLWFSDEELASYVDESHAVAVAWAIKESLYKATNHGEPFRPRDFGVFTEGKTYCCFRQQRPLPVESLTVRHIGAHVVVSVGVRDHR